MIVVNQELPLRQIIQGNCLEVMKCISDKSVDLVIWDPPYNIGKDSWDKIVKYEQWLRDVFLEIQRVLKDNGSLYWFHSEMEVIAEMMIWLRHHSNFIFRQFIVWNKRFKGSLNKGFLDGYVEVENLRNYQQMAEYVLYYTFQDETGLSKVMSNCIYPIRDYIRSEIMRAKGHISLVEINTVLGTATNGGGVASACLSLDKTVPAMITEEHYLKLRDWLNQEKEYSYLRKEYEDLRKEYEDLRFTFNNQKTHHSVWNYDISSETEHPTEKPEALIANIIKHSSKQDAIILDPCAGSGTTALAAEKQQRKWIAIESDERYCRIARKRLEPWMNQSRLDSGDLKPYVKFPDPTLEAVKA